MLKRPKILLCDESVSNLDSATAEQFAKTINRLKGKVTILFITHKIPRALAVDAVITLGDHCDPARRSRDSGNPGVEPQGIESRV